MGNHHGSNDMATYESPDEKRATSRVAPGSGKAEKPGIGPNKEDTPVQAQGHRVDTSRCPECARKDYPNSKGRCVPKVVLPTLEEAGEEVTQTMITKLDATRVAVHNAEIQQNNQEQAANHSRKENKRRLEALEAAEAEAERQKIGKSKLARTDTDSRKFMTKCDRKSS